MRHSAERKGNDFAQGKPTETKGTESHNISSSFAQLQSHQNYMSNSPHGQRAERKSTSLEPDKPTETKGTPSASDSLSFAYLKRRKIYMSNSPDGQRAAIYLKFYRLLKTLLLPLIQRNERL